MRMKVFRLGRALPRLALAIIAVLAVPAPGLLTAQEALPSAESLADRHVRAIGGREAVLRHTSTRVTGTVAVPSSGLTGSFEAFAAKPDKQFLRVTLAGIGESLEGFDGRVAWTTSALTGPMLVQGKEYEQKKFSADYYADLRQAERYKSMKTLEKTTWEGRSSYKVSLIRHDGSEEIEYYDVETGFKTGSVVTREMMMMGAVPVTSVASDYRKFGDVMHASTTKQIAMGAQIVMTITSVEYDKVDPAVFELPPAIKALVKP
jgi:hypothetical protein